MPIKAKITVPTGQSKKVFEGFEDPIAGAAKRTMEIAGDRLKALGRGSIAAAGFSSKWQNALRVNVYPRGKIESIDSAAFLYHKIGYANVFEEGAVIRGKPYMWVPLTSSRNLLGKRRLTPAEYKRRIGPLRFVQRPGGRPLLMGEVASNARTVSRASLRRGAGRGGRAVRSVPIFVGVPVVRISRKFRIREAAVQVRASLPGIFKRFLRS